MDKEHDYEVIVIDETITAEKTAKKQKRDEWIKIALIIVVVTVFIGGFFAIILWGGKLLIDEARNLMSHNAIIDDVSAGTVSDKEIVNGHKTGGGGVIYSNGQLGYYYGGDKDYVPTRYRLHITFEYEYEGETYQGTKYYDVSEEVYLAYEIGDYFDSHDFNRIEITTSVSP